MITIPRNVADAIESFRKEGRDNEFILSVRRFTKDRCRTYRAEVLAMYANTSGFEALLEALVNGYEREKTPEEIAEEERQAAYELVKSEYKRRKREHVLCLIDLPQKSARSGGFADGIKFALNELGISIEGVSV